MTATQEVCGMATPLDLGGGGGVEVSLGIFFFLSQYDCQGKAISSKAPLKYF